MELKLWCEGMLTTCPDCGEDATYNDDGLVCDNPDCSNSK